MDDVAWDTVGRLVEWLDRSSGSNNALTPETEKLLRLMKLTEEVGEVAEAVIGVTGQNPRKGVTHSWDDVNAELCDVILTAMVALTTITPNARQVFAERLNHVATRSLNDTVSQPTEP